MFFDIKRRRPVSVFDEIVKKWSFIDEESIEHNISSKIDTVQTGDYKKEFKTIKTKDTGRICACATTRWKPRS